MGRRAFINPVQATMDFRGDGKSESNGRSRRRVALALLTSAPRSGVTV